MGSLLQNGGNVNMSDDAVVKQLQADVARMAAQVADIHQAVALWPGAFGGLEDQVKHAIDKSNQIIDLIADPNNPDAGIAALAGISKLVTIGDAHAMRLHQLEAGQAALIDRIDVHDSHVETRIVRAAEGQADDIRKIARRQLILVGAMTALATLMLIHSYEVAARLDAAFIPTIMFVLGLISRGR